MHTIKTLNNKSHEKTKSFLTATFYPDKRLSPKSNRLQKQQNYKEWVHIAPKFDDDFFKTEEAQRIGDNVLLYQQTTGGWPKNIYMPAELTEQEYNAALKAKEDTNQSTIDNNATTTEIEYLSRLYLATQKEKYKEGVLNGIQYCSNRSMKTVDGLNFIRVPKVIMYKSPTMTMQW